MINRKIQLVSPHLFIQKHEDIMMDGTKVLIRPTLLSICAADLRYYTGNRDEKALKEKLPMALIHEGIGKVLYDPTQNFAPGDMVVMIPNTPSEFNSKIKENYRRDSKFRSSSQDGFMQDYILMDSDRILSIEGIDDEAAVLLELISVIYNSLEALPEFERDSKLRIGIWGNGNLGYLMSLVFRDKYPDSYITVLGRDVKAGIDFTKANQMINIDDDLSDLDIDIAFECVGGNGSEKAINQIIDVINPQGYVGILGVSEKAPSLNTRMILEKGLRIQGASRSGRIDFERGIRFLEKNKRNQEDVKRLITERKEISELSDISASFDTAISTKYKTILNWNI